MHARSHARTHACTHARRTHARTHARRLVRTRTRAWIHNNYAAIREACDVTQYDFIRAVCMPCGGVTSRTPVSPSARQPVSPSARQPVSPSARQPVSPSARQPVSPSARQPVSPSARQPGSLWRDGRLAHVTAIRIHMQHYVIRVDRPHAKLVDVIGDVIADVISVAGALRVIA